MLIHLITICIGLIIAFGLQQIIELFQRRRRIRKQRAVEQQAIAGLQAITPSKEHFPPPDSQL